VKKRYVLAAATVTAALGLSLKDWEEAPNVNPGVPYKDIVGVWTVCTGLTGKWLEPNKYYTPEECDRLLASDIYRKEANISKCIDLKSLPERIQFAAQHITYNIGEGAFCKSTMRKQFSVGNFDAGCKEIAKWTFLTIGGKKVNCRDPKWQCRGIPRRRAYEQGTCDGSIDWREQAWEF
jgi:lysozyme